MPILVKIEKLQNIEEESKAKKESSRLLKKKNRRLKFQVNAYLMKKY